MSLLIEKYPDKMAQVLADASVNSLMELLRLHDEEAYIHSMEVARLVTLCLTKLEEGNSEIWEKYAGETEIEIIKGALLHDIGKAFLPFGIQHSTLKLDAYSKEIIKMHTILGYFVLRQSNFSKPVLDIALMHHLNEDGTGYPMNLSDPDNPRPYDAKNEMEVPGYIWLVSYADRFEAMTSSRKFKHSLSYSEAWEKMTELKISGKLPYIYSKVFREVVRELNLQEVLTTTSPEVLSCK